MSPTRRMILAGAAVGVGQAAAASAEERTASGGGVLRAAFLMGNPAQALFDSKTETWRGVAVDLATAFAAQRGLTLELQPVRGVAPLIDAVAGSAADIGFLAADPTREGKVRFSEVYLRNPQSVIVRVASPIQRLEEFGAAGAVLGVTQNDSVGLFIERNLPKVKLVRVDGTDVSMIAAFLATGAVDGFAASRLRLREILKFAPGFRLVPGSLFGVPQAIVVDADASDLLDHVNKFISAAKRDGSLAAAIARADIEVEIEP